MLQRLRAALLISVLGLCAPGIAWAANGEIFTVTGVELDATAATAAEARGLALAQGQRRALARLLRRFTRRQDHEGLPQPSTAQLTELVQSFEIDNERTSAVRYLADLTVHFNTEAVIELLRNAGVPFAQTVSKPVLVLPVYQVADSVALWDETNPWKQAWEIHAPRSGLVPIVIPFGELEDIEAISAAQALQEDLPLLRAFAQRHQASDTLLAIATPRVDETTGQNFLGVVARRLGQEGPAVTIYQKRLTVEAEGMDELMRQAVVAVSDTVEGAWKQQNVLRFDIQGQLQLTIPVSDIEEWAEVRRRLASVISVRRADLTQLSRRQARLSITYVGAPEQLRTAMSQNDLSLRQEFDQWVLRLDGPAGRTAPAAPETSIGGTGLLPLPPAMQDPERQSQHSVERADPSMLPLPEPGNYGDARPAPLPPGSIFQNPQ